MRSPFCCKVRSAISVNGRRISYAMDGKFAFRAAVQGHAMLSQEILALAQQGHSIAIATLLNYVTRSHGVKAKVQRQNHCLHVLLEAQQLLDQEKAIAFLQRILSVLNVQSIQTIMVYSRRQGETHLDWRQTIQFPFPSSFEPSLLDTSFSEPPDLLLSDLPLPRRNFVTQASNSFPESLEPASPAPIDAPTELQTEDEQSFTVQHPASDTRSPASPQPLEEVSYAAAANSPFPDLSGSDDLLETPDVLKRPESVIFLLFISLFVFWDAYVDFLEADFSPGATAISASQLARRLKVSRKTIRRRKREPDFSTWTQSLDPDQIAWVYRKGYYLSQS
ncbi:hypothetical protein [Leptolyngbya sp. ST-U4]|uniref:hypothetical protein n=1 Tax=Leptolyngbya sp. ST-U4 TaxID=2933912 RepID=UPI0032994346